MSEIADAIWSSDYTPDDGLPMGTKLYDWVFLVLPEPSVGLAEQRFRQKWMSTPTESIQDPDDSQGNVVTMVFGSDPTNPDRIEDILLNIGMALSGLTVERRPFVLEDVDLAYICDLIEIWIRISSARPSIVPSIGFGDERARFAVELFTKTSGG